MPPGVTKRGRILGCSMKHGFLVVLALLPAWVHAQAPAGPHAVGFRVIEHWDRTRVPAPPLDFRGEATDAPQATPMLVGVWYPARPTNRAPMRDVDYRMLQQRKETLGAPRAGDREAAAAGLKSIAQFGLGLELDDAAIAAALERPFSAVRDAEPATGVFPLVLGGLEGPAAAAPLAEYLASHGYVVLSSPSLSAVGSQQVNAPQLALETQTRNIEVLRGIALTLPYVDPTRLGVIGVNFDGMAALNYQLRNMDARAVVSLDGYEAKALDTNVIGRSPYYDARRMRVPYLVFSQANAPNAQLRADPTQLNLWPFSERRMRVVKDLAHVHYVGAIWSLDRIPADVRAARASVNATVLDFLNAHVRGDADARARAFTHTPAASLELDSALAALPAAPTPAEFERLVMAGDPAAVRQVVNQLRRADSTLVLFTENEMNLFVFRFTQQGKVDVALDLLALTAEHHPRSARAAYRYANALALRLESSADGQDPALATRARAELERAAALLPTDTALSDADRDAIRSAIAERLASVRLDSQSSCSETHLGTRTSHVMTYDPTSQRVLLFGGLAGRLTDEMPRSLWAWTGEAWTCIAGDGPPGRADAFLAYDNARQRMVLFGGRRWTTSGQMEFMADTWEWDGKAWSLKDSAGPAPRIHGAAAYDATRRTVLIHGGAGATAQRRDTWEWNGTAWRSVPLELPFEGNANSLVPSSAGVTVVGAAPPTDETCPFRRARLFEFAGGRLRDLASIGPCFSPQIPITASPEGLLLFAGWNREAPAESWVWSEGRWRRTDSAPTRRRGTAAAFDMARGRVVLFGGNDERGSLSDTWEWDGRVWTQIGGSR